MGSIHKGVLCSCIIFLLTAHAAEASYHFSNFEGYPPIHELGAPSTSPVGITPSQIKQIYNLPDTGGTGTIAIIGAYNDLTIESDLADFDTQFNLPVCTIKNGCFEKHIMSNKIKSNSGWSMETTLDVEWAHAIAPHAKILLVQAVTPSGSNFIKAIDYANSRADVVAISMSWGGAEFPEEVSLDDHFKSKYGATFFASSGDNGTGASWPASSPGVIGVGGTTIIQKSNGLYKSEVAWSGSGGGISVYEKIPEYQKNTEVREAHGMRTIPDVAYNADPTSGFPIVRNHVWHRVGGTSAGAPQWAALSTLGHGITLGQLYIDKSKSNSAQYFRDILTGDNGACGSVCSAHKQYDTVTGLGSPQTINY